MEKILIYAMSENMGGVEEYVLNLSRFNFEKKATYEYVILGKKTPYREEMEKLGVKIHYIPQKSELKKNICELRNLLKRERQECDIIYFNTSSLCYPVPYILAKKYNYKIVLHSHLTGADGIRRYVHLFNRWWINKICYKRLACSTPAAIWMFGNEDNVTIIPNAIQIERFKYLSEKRCELRKQLKFDEETIVVGHVGRLSAVKNQSFLLRLISEGINMKLLLVGDGEDEKKLRQEARELGIEDRTIFYGKTKEPEKLMNCMDCFVMPSFVEGFPITLVEAQANGLPCLVSDVITKETNITGHVWYKSINRPINEWLNIIEEIAGKRYNGTQILNDKGYNVEKLEAMVRNTIINSDL